MPIEKHDRVGEDAPPVSILSQIGRGIKKDTTARYLSVYLGLAVIIIFLVAVSVLPQVSNKLGTLQTKKQSQESLANVDYYITLKANGQSPSTRVSSGQQVTISWNATRLSSFGKNCFASGDWSGTKALKGSTSVYPTKQTNNYILTCKYGTSPAAQPLVKQVTVYTTASTTTLPTGAKYSPCAPLGYVDDNNYINAADANYITDYLFGTADQKQNANFIINNGKGGGDVNKNGKLDQDDAFQIVNFLAGQQITFSGCPQ